MDETLAVDAVAGAIAPATPTIAGLKHRYILLLLLGAYTLSFLDRQVVNILAESIKRDLKISNFQLGMLTGLAFATFYTFLGIPIARQADKRSRPLIIAGSMALWSGFTVLSGVAGSFAVMAVARLGVGFGEAGCNPCAHSMIADITPPERRGSALAFYSLGVPIGTILGLVLGGGVADAFGWRMAFMVAGAPGLILAGVIGLTVREPRSHLAAHVAARAVTARSLGHTLRELGAKRSFWLMAVAAGLTAFVGYGHASFSTPFFLRVHGPEVAAIAHRLGLGPLVFLGIAGALTTGVGALIGTWTGGWLADKAAARDKRAYMSLPAIACLAIAPFIWFIYTVPGSVLALGLGLFPAVLGTLWYGPVYATAQSVVSPQSRATTAAILLFVLNLIGLGLGPMCVGALNDLLAGPAFGLGQAEGLRWALIISGMAFVAAAALFWLARDTVREDIIS
ncbi:MAG TPA: MFS transporter [Caulobacteraceae bacterium]|nr:MFS transporter [Caulobacteraceae bacterium]